MADENERHSVLIVGIDGIPGGAAAASARLEQKFRLPRPVAERLVASIPAVVKKDVSMDDAQRYAVAIRSIGADARIVPYSANTQETAAVTGILKRHPRVRMSEAKRGDVSTASGGYVAMKQERGAGGGSSREEGAAAAGSVPAAAAGSQGLDSQAETWAASDSIGTAKTIMGTAFDPSSFALPSTLNSETDDDGVTFPDAVVAEDSDRVERKNTLELTGHELSGADVDLVQSETSEGNRPSLFDELMSMGDSGLGMPLDRGDFGLSESGEGSARVRPDPPRPAAYDANQNERSPTSPTQLSSSTSTTGPTRVDQFGNVDLGLDPSDSGSTYQLDTDKPHLTGSFAAISDSAGFKYAEGSAGINSPAVPGKPSSKRTGRRSSQSDPLAEEIERTLRKSQPVDRTKAGAAGSLRGHSRNVTGGFSAAAERNRNSNSRFAKVVGWLILLIILAGGSAAGYVFYERWAATLEAKSFAEAPNYFEHTTRISRLGDGASNFVRGCAQPDASVPTFSCRYSREFYQSRFPDSDPDLHAAAAAQCYGSLFDDGRSSAELLDCTVSVPLPEGPASARFYAAFHRECETSLVLMESGDTTQCFFREAIETLPRDAPLPASEPVTVEVEYKRPFELDTDVGGLASREYLFTGVGLRAEYHYFAESVGFFVRVAELGGAASLRLTFADRGGNTAGHQAWPR